MSFKQKVCENNSASKPKDALFAADRLPSDIITN